MDIYERPDYLFDDEEPRMHDHLDWSGNNTLFGEMIPGDETAEDTDDEADADDDVEEEDEDGDEDDDDELTEDAQGENSDHDDDDEEETDEA